MPHLMPVQVRLGDHTDLHDVCHLAHDCYVTEGYCRPQAGGCLSHYELLDVIPETTVFLAERDGELVGSVSFTLDSAAGLHTDSAFHVETNCERVWCGLYELVLAASWRIVTDPRCRGRLDVLLALVKQGLVHLEMMGVDELLCTFNPKHARAWKRLLGMEVIAGPRRDPAVEGAPAVLMRGVVAAMIRHFRERNPQI